MYWESSGERINCGSVCSNNLLVAAVTLLSIQIMAGNNRKKGGMKDSGRSLDRAFLFAERVIRAILLLKEIGRNPSVPIPRESMMVT